jgi:hypothetical protein
LPLLQPGENPNPAQRTQLLQQKALQEATRLAKTQGEILSKGAQAIASGQKLIGPKATVNLRNISDPKILNSLRQFAEFARQQQRQQEQQEFLSQAGSLMPKLSDPTIPRLEKHRIRGEIGKFLTMGGKAEQGRLVAEPKSGFSTDFNRLARARFGSNRNPESLSGPEASIINNDILNERSRIRAAGAVAEAKARRQFLLESPYVIAAGQNAKLEFVRNTRTGRPITGGEPYKDILAGLRNGQLIQIGPEKNRIINNMQQAVPLVNGLRDKIERAYSAQGVLGNVEGATGRLTKAGVSAIARFRQTDAEFVALDRMLKALPERFGRLTTGAVGVQTERDVERFKALLANVRGIPDSKAVAFAMINELYDIIERTQQAVLFNLEYRDPRIQRLEIPSVNLRGGRRPVNP